MTKFEKYALMLILMLSILGYSNDIKYNDSWGSQGFSLTESKSYGVSITHSVNEFSITDQMINKQMKSTVQLPGVFLPNEEGAPNLPGSSRYIAIPQGATATYTIRASQKEVFQNINLAPAPIIPKGSDKTPMIYKENLEIYSKDVFYPSSPVIMSKPTKMRGLDVVTLGITPFQYNPVTKELIVYRDLKIDITFEGGNNHFGEDRLRNRHWDKILKNTVINNSVIKDIEYKYRSYSKSTDYEYIIICPDDSIFVSYANQLKEFRIKQGIRTGVVTTSDIGGNTAVAIETYINNAYNTWDIPPSAILLLGDWGEESTVGTVHSPIYNSYCISDNSYADVDTADDKGLPEITIARMTAQNEAQLQTMISKIIDYETSPPTDVNFYNNPITALGWQTTGWFQICAEAVGGYMKNELGKTPVRINAIYAGNPDVDPWSTATNTDQVRSYFASRGYIPWSPSSLGGWTGGTTSDVSNALNNGAFLLLHRDHGVSRGWIQPDFKTEDIDSITNTDLSFIFSINCSTGKFNNLDECFAERFHRHTYNGENSGALGIIAATESSFSFYNDVYTWGMYDYFWPNFMDDYGAPATDNDEFLPAFASVNGKYFLDYSSWHPSSTANRVTNYLFHMLGDPYLNVYTEVPQNLTVNHEDIYEGQSYIHVASEIGANIALVANGEIIGTGTSTGGLTSILIDPQLASTEITLTITKQNYFRYETTLEVLLADPSTGGIYNQLTISLDYGTIQLGESLTQQFSIANSHGTESIVGGISVINGYTVSLAKENKNVTNYNVPPNTEYTYDLMFNPSEAGTFNGNIVITSSASNQAIDSIAVTGVCVIPDIDLNPTVVFASSSPDITVVEHFNINNLDLGILHYNIAVSYTSGGTGKETKIYGGPDSYGYWWKDSDEWDGPVYNWEEINVLGTALGLSDDGESASLPLGFTFNYYGVDYTSVIVGANGAITFTGTEISGENAFIPTNDGTNTIIAAFWDNLDPESSGEIYCYHDVANSRFIIEWDAVVDFGALTPNTFQIILNEDGKIYFQYKDMQGVLDECSIGIEDHTGFDGSLITYNTAYIKNDFAIEFKFIPKWLSLDITSGTIPGSESQEIAATCDATGLDLEQYVAYINIFSNDPDEFSTELPVVFTVSALMDAPQNPTTVSITASEVNLIWDAVDGATIYYVYRSTEPYSGFVQIGTSATLDYTDNDVSGSNKYFYYITADNAK
ncbi:MAG: hypothetical protein GQ534_10875 [Candidatus Delongbacteria bacterium]|nr:hypothetical protein [Candidatus Delongbacteria bacterium]